jgi:hypothetical protein
LAGSNDKARELAQSSASYSVLLTILLFPTQILAASSWFGGSHRAWHSHHVLAVSWSEFKASRNGDVTWCQPKLTVKVKHLAGSNSSAMPR